MEIADIPVPPTPPSSSTGPANGSNNADTTGALSSDAWRKAQEALQNIGGNQPASMAEATAAYNQYYQSLQYNMYPGGQMGGETPPWMQSAYMAWGQQAVAAGGGSGGGNYPRFGFNSAPTPPNLATSGSSSFSEQSSSESLTSTPSSRPAYRQSTPSSRSLLGVAPGRGAGRPGLGFRGGHRGGGGGAPIRFDIGGGRPRQVTMQYDRVNPEGNNDGLGMSGAFIDRSTNNEAVNNNNNPEGDKKMPDAMEAYITRAFAAATSVDQKNQVEQALKQRIYPLLHSGEAWHMDWDQEPLPTDNDYALRLLRATLQARGGGRGGHFPAGSRMLSSRGGGIGRGAFTGTPNFANNPNFEPLGMRGGVGNAHPPPQQQHQQPPQTPISFGLRGRGVGGIGLRGRGGQRGGFGGRQSSIISRSRSRSNSSDESKSTNQTSRRRKRDSGDHNSDGSSKKRYRRESTSSRESIELKYGKGGKKAGKKNKKNKKRFMTEDVDNDDSADDEHNGSFNKIAKKKKKGLKFTMDKHQSKVEQDTMKQQRAMRFAKHMAQHAGVGGSGPSKSLASRLGKRRGNGGGGDLYMDDRSNDSNVLDVEFDPTAFLIVGTCEILEKQYFRLTAVPDPSQVRPEAVLKRALPLVKQKWKNQSDYRYVCDQLKSIRQDMTIQCIRNRFSVDVYETHARIALEKGDREEFNQCQSQLKALYSELPGCPNEYEFTAYRLLFYVYMENTMDITTILAHLTPAMFDDECISFALKIRHAWSLRNYSKFFKLARTGRPPRMCTYVLELFKDRERKRGLNVMLKGYRPTIPVEYIADTLSFETEDDCAEYLRQLQIPFVEDDETKVDCRQNIPAF